MLQGLTIHVAQRLLSWRRHGDYDEEDAYLLARDCDARGRLGLNGDGCLGPVAGAGWRLARRGMER